MNSATHRAPATPLAAINQDTLNSQDTCGQREARGGRSAGGSQPQA